MAGVGINPERGRPAELRPDATNRFLGGYLGRLQGTLNSIAGFWSPARVLHSIAGFWSPAGVLHSIAGFWSPAGVLHSIAGFWSPAGVLHSIAGFWSPAGVLHSIAGFWSPAGRLLLYNSAPISGRSLPAGDLKSEQRHIPAPIAPYL